MNQYVIIIAGIPASGKTTYGRHIAEKLRIPFISKDAFKEKLYDALHFDTTDPDNSRLYGAASYAVFYHTAECLMKSNISLVIESNFTPTSSNVLIPLVRQYAYKALTVLFDADIKVLHERFCKRDVTYERHSGLTSKSGVYYNFDVFSKATLPLREFVVGEKIVIDTSDFALVDYDKIDVCVQKWLEVAKSE